MKKLRSHNTSYFLVELVTKAGLTVYGHFVRLPVRYLLLTPC